MISKLNIQNYKSHLNSEIDFKPLTVFTGKNGAGKSSIIQSLLLLRQSYLENSEFKEGLILNEDLVEIGRVKDAWTYFAADDFISFGLEFNKIINCYTKFLIDTENRQSDYSVLDKKNSDISADIKKESLFVENLRFQYIATEHIGPTETHKRSTRIAETKGQISHKKGQAEYAIHVLNANRNKKIANLELQHESIAFTDLFENVNAWLGEISEGVTAVIVDNLDSFKLSFQFNTADNLNTSEFKPQNVGFGISYALPVVLALLATPADGLVLLENPEAHIHPSGQAKLAELIAITAQTGVQVVLETHSDHLINGILVACKKMAEGAKGISPQNVAIYYIDRDENSQEAKVTPVPIVQGYRIKHAPAGFFDQFRIDIKYLSGF